MENTVVDKETSQAALYFKPRVSMGFFTSPVDESNPAGVWREWTHPKTGEPGKTYELQVRNISGKIIDARIHTQEFDDRKTTEFLLALSMGDLVRVIKIPVKDQWGLDKHFRKFGRICPNIDTSKELSVDLGWKPEGHKVYPMVFKQGKGVPSAYPYVDGAYRGLPDPVETKAFDGTVQKDYTEHNKVLYDNVVAFCEKVQALNSLSQTSTEVDEEEEAPF